jgi:hypothetical protein
MAGLLAVLVVPLLLSACGQSREMRAAAACEKAMGERLGDRPYKVDLAAIAATAKAESGDIVAFESEAVIDAAQANESTQRFICRVQFDPSKPDAEPAVILFQFNF